MEHSHIDENTLIDRYVRGTMPVEERAAFEEHFLDCPQCLEQLEIARSLRAALRISAEEMAMATSPEVPRNLSFGARLSRWRWATAAATACAVIALVPGIVLFRQLERARSE